MEDVAAAYLEEEEWNYYVGKGIQYVEVNSEK